MSDEASGLDPSDEFVSAHLIAIDNALGMLVRRLHHTGVIDQKTVKMIDSAYQKPLDQHAGNEIVAQLRRLHDDFYSAILTDRPES